MARTRKEIKAQITATFMANEMLAEKYGFEVGNTFENEFSLVSLENIIFDIIAFAIFVFELILDNHKSEIDTLILEQKSGTANWYKNLALRFQYGFDLITDSDKYDNTGIDQAVVDASKIVKYCSVKRSLESSRLIIKIASQEGDELIRLTEQQLESFTEYMDETGYEGDKLLIVNNPADQLLLNLFIYRDPLVLDVTGMSILNADRPVETAIKQYLKELKFNGEFVINDLIEKLRAVPGVNNAHVVAASSSSYDTITEEYLPFEFIDVKVIPDAGYFQLVNFDDVSYVV